ncbi:uridine kinase [Rossellomorea vietnamensis]|uniref:Uridine kinase n=1 Tax=Rossellomorea vietnamensis TaxID=218284 RepID=A0A6I6UPB0_9BACI|nr:kinase [Rossellomorea vietnamensis]QHE60552.1 uridine kinase [Rossellomorea vietnamensis]
MINVTTALLSHYPQHHLKHRPFIVGIDGLGGSGKTTLAQSLKQELILAKCDAVILHMDDYIVEKSERYGTGNEEWYEYYALQWNIELLRKELFERLHGGYDSITLPIYESSADSVVSKPIHLDGVKVVLIEGVFLQRKEWRDFFDFVIFLDCPSELRSERVIGRDTYLGDERARVEKYKRRYWLAEDHYLLHENTAGKADYIESI